MFTLLMTHPVPFAYSHFGNLVEKMNLQTDGYREFAWKFAYESRHFSQRIQRSRADLGHLSLQLPNEPLTMQSAHCKLHVNVLERVG